MTGRPWELRTLDREAVAGLQEAIAEERTEQLEQEAAFAGEEWDDAKQASVFAQQMKGASLLAGLLAARGFTQPEEALSFLAGEDSLSDPFLMKDMDKACARIRQALEQGETIVVYGDYDVDGVTATSLLYEQLKGLGGVVKCMLPSREGDGYGLSKRAIDRIHEKGYTLIVTVDNGISAVEEAAYAASLGIDLVITDHHLPPSTLPEAVAVVDPRREDDHSPFKDLCGAGVAFKLCAALEDCMPEELLEFCSDLAAIGTVADVMPLNGENRTIVKAGLQILQHTERPGLAALLEEVGLAGKNVTADNVSFGIAPRLNAAGRMDSAATALQLVLCEDPDRASCLAHHLNEINAQRQETEQKIERAVEEMLAAEPDRTEDRVMLLWGSGWHQGVIGIVASRLVEKYGRPVMVVSIAENGEAKGSGRSVPGFNLHGCITACSDLLIRFGGHAMAAGLLVREENLPELRRRMNEWAARECPVIQAPPLVCDLSLRLARVTVEEIRAVERMAPFGADNPAPVFLLENAVVEGIYPVSEGKHSRLRLHQGGAGLYAVWFGMAPERVPYQTGDAVDAALSLSVYEGARGAQISGRILDLHPAGLGPDAPRQAALVDALRRGASLSAEERQLICPSREEVAAVYRELKTRRWHADDLQPLCARMGTASTGKTLVAVTALKQVGLVEEAERDGVPYLELVRVSGKKNLADAPILKCLEEK
ncbi:single-stranded-DNA-specific exonuclease RecJ [Faecalibacterium sp. An77]|uniref:single-stranded-DNA-specific exonuclease RecJ n=1 Tax=Faecalibacterium sp. An77 TaxID=1965655 RepID=UPI000B3AEE23|nr:single-stranded-DNA-specific exonuclease RecJ [Faecalibacterium sp. An77]OUN40094.1 single-stranded-DNA-specific exonuclease RecJ [Faecalibacterium sp. An77]